MAKGKRTESGWTPSQLVAHNLTRARELRGLTQAEVAERLGLFTGTAWTATTVGQAEGSVSGNRVRQFTANELVALARTFDLPVLYFFLPPEDGAGELRTPDAGGRSWEYLLMLVWGHTENFPMVADRAAPWAHASPPLIPRADLVNPDPGRSSLAGQDRRAPFTPQDMLAVAFNGLARKGVRGAVVPGEDVETMAANLRLLADALTAFNNGLPGEFFETELLRAMEARREPIAKKEKR